LAPRRRCWVVVRVLAVENGGRVARLCRRNLLDVCVADAEGAEVVEKVGFPRLTKDVASTTIAGCFAPSALASAAMAAHID